MVIELRFRNSKNRRRKVQIWIGYKSIEEIVRKNPKLLKLIIDTERRGSEYLEKVKELDI